MDQIGWLFVLSHERDFPEVAGFVRYVVASPVGSGGGAARRHAAGDDPDLWVFGGRGEPEPSGSIGRRPDRRVVRGGAVAAVRRLVSRTAAAR